MINIDASVIMAVTGTAAAVFWMWLFITGKGKYKDVLNTKAALNLKFCEIFYIGFLIMKMLNTDVRSRRYAVQRKNIIIVYGPEYADFYTYLFAGAQITYAATIFPIALLTGAAADSILLAFLGITASVLMLFYIDAEIKKRANEKNDEILCELPDMVVRLSLLLNTGMVLRDAWTLISQSSDSALYREMRKTSEDIRNGIPEGESFELFADRCRNKEISKFVSALLQNIKKGSAGLSEILQFTAAEQWEEKKNYVRKKASAAEQKLLVPMLMIFAAIIMMIIVPVFANMF